MKKFHFYLFFFLPLVSMASPQSDSLNFRSGVLGTSFIFNSGSTALDYKFLIDYKIHGRHTIELKFAIRDANQDGSRNLYENEETETIMINCKLKTFTPSYWLEKNENAHGHRQYSNGSKFKWDDKEDGQTNYGKYFPSYLGMICDSL